MESGCQIFRRKRPIKGTDERLGASSTQPSAPWPEATLYSLQYLLARLVALLAMLWLHPAAHLDKA